MFCLLIVVCACLTNAVCARIAQAEQHGYKYCKKCYCKFSPTSKHVSATNSFDLVMSQSMEVMTPKSRGPKTCIKHYCYSETNGERGENLKKNPLNNPANIFAPIISTNGADSKYSDTHVPLQKVTASSAAQENQVYKFMGQTSANEYSVDGSAQNQQQRLRIPQSLSSPLNLSEERERLLQRLFAIDVMSAAGNSGNLPNDRAKQIAPVSDDPPRPQGTPAVRQHLSTWGTFSHL